MAPSRKARALKVPTRWPERDSRKHDLTHFERFFSTLRMPDGGARGRLHDSQLAKLADFFHEWAEDGKIVRPGFFENLWLEPTGAGKSTLMAALALHHCCYVRTDPRCYVLGGLGEQARNTTEAAAGFIARSVDLGKWFQETQIGLGVIKSLHPEDTDGAGIIASSAGRRTGERAGAAQEGKTPTLVLVEETHRHEDNGAAIATLIAKVQKRSFAGLPVQVVHATTAGESLDSPLGRLVKRVTDEDGRAKIETNLRPGEYYRRAVDADGDLVMHEWSVPEAIQPPPKNSSPERLQTYLEHVKRANPMPMVSIRSLRLIYRALSAEPWVFLRQNANQWVTQDFAAIDRFSWNRCGRGREWARREKAAPIEIPAGRHESVFQRGAPGVYVGLDMAGKWDRTAIVPVWVDPESRRPRTAGAVVLGDDQALGSQRRARNVLDILSVMNERWPGMAIVFDRAYGGGLIAEQFEEDHGLLVVSFEQKGAPMELASMLFAELIDQGSFEHDEQPDLTAHVLSAVMKRSHYGHRWRLEQPRDGRPIDAAAAAAMATFTAMNPPKPDRPPVDLSRFKIQGL